MALPGKSNAHPRIADLAPNPILLVIYFYGGALVSAVGSVIVIKYVARLLANQPFSYGPDRFVDNLFLEVTVKEQTGA
jgi:hypothetical protein